MHPAATASCPMCRWQKPPILPIAYASSAFSSKRRKSSMSRRSDIAFSSPMRSRPGSFIRFSLPSLAGAAPRTVFVSVSAMGCFPHLDLNQLLGRHVAHLGIAAPRRFRGNAAVRPVAQLRRRQHVRFHYRVDSPGSTRRDFPRLLLRVIARAHQGPRLHVAESELPLAHALPLGELF